MTKSTITRERAEQLANFKGAPVTRQEEQELARIALAAMDSEPVAYIGERVLEDMAEGYCGRVWPFNKDELSGESRIPLYRHAQPAPAVPDEMPCGGAADDYHDGYQDGWNACRAAMLQAEPVTTANKLGNSPVIPDGYVMVPKEATLDMLKAGAKQEMKGEAFQYVWQAMLAAAPQEVSDA